MLTAVNYVAIAENQKNCMKKLVYQNVHEIDSWIELWKSPFLDLKFKKGHIQIVHEGVLIFPK